MAWNWGSKKSNTLVRRKADFGPGGENSNEVKELSNSYIRLGLTRQQAISKARKKLKESFMKKDVQVINTGTFSKK